MDDPAFGILDVKAGEAERGCSCACITEDTGREGEAGRASLDTAPMAGEAGRGIPPIREPGRGTPVARR